MEKENVTNEQLAELIQGYGSELQDLKKTVDVIERGAFTEDEKEDMLTVIRQINQQLRDDALGKKSITLTRSEYDNAANTERFENRFEKTNSSIV